jgi:hypothetical protein
MTCCEKNLPALNSWCRDEQRWTCPICGTVWLHVCDEAEGCFWENEIDVEAEEMR